MGFFVGGPPMVIATGVTVNSMFAPHSASGKLDSFFFGVR